MMTQKLSRRLFSVAVMASVCMSAAHAQSQPSVPQRVVVYDLATLDTMQTLGIPVTGVPKAQFPAYLAGYGDAKYTVAGSLFEPDYDVLSKIKPD